MFPPTTAEVEAFKMTSQYYIIYQAPETLISHFITVSYPRGHLCYFMNGMSISFSDAVEVGWHATRALSGLKVVVTVHTLLTQHPRLFLLHLLAFILFFCLVFSTSRSTFSNVKVYLRKMFLSAFIIFFVFFRVPTFPPSTKNIFTIFQKIWSVFVKSDSLSWI